MQGSMALVAASLRWRPRGRLRRRRSRKVALAAKKEAAQEADMAAGMATVWQPLKRIGAVRGRRHLMRPHMAHFASRLTQADLAHFVSRFARTRQLIIACVLLQQNERFVLFVYLNTLHVIVVVTRLPRLCIVH